MCDFDKVCEVKYIVNNVHVDADYRVVHTTTVFLFHKIISP